jgi:hypothetical protein
MENGLSGSFIAAIAPRNLSGDLVQDTQSVDHGRVNAPRNGSTLFGRVPHAGERPSLLLNEGGEAPITGRRGSKRIRFYLNRHSAL